MLGKGSTKFWGGFNYKILQVKLDYNYPTTKIQVLTTMNERFYNNYERDMWDTQDTNRQDLKRMPKCES